MELTAVAAVYGRLSRSSCGVLGGLILAEIERLSALPDGATSRDIQACLGSNPSTIFRRIETLAAAGLVTSVTLRPSGGRYGKAPKVYSLTPAGLAELEAAKQFAQEAIG